MPKVCFYFQLHQPYRLNDVSVFYVGKRTQYYSSLNKEVFNKVAVKSYLPMLRLLRKLTKKHLGFSFSLSCSGIFLEQARLYQPKIIELIFNLVKTKQIELLAETYFHSLACLYSEKEFKRQIRSHSRIIEKLFRVTPQIFRNTELIYSNHIAEIVSQLGYQGILTEAVDRYLKKRKRTQVFFSKTKKPIPLLLKHARLSDDIAFRFSNKHWSEYPLGVEKYSRWFDEFNQEEVINLFMDFETFGEHQWRETGIFSFFEKFVSLFLKSKNNQFVMPSQVLLNANELIDKDREKVKTQTYDVTLPISWADENRDISAWVDNDLQKDSIKQLYKLEKKVLASKNKSIVKDWRRLQCSDHFYYMSTKWSHDGSVHAYFSHFKDPFEAYRQFCIVLAHLKVRLE